MDGLAAEFPGMQPHTRDAVPALFDAYAPSVDAAGTRGLDLQLFSSTYAAILFSLFDVNNDGQLQLDEAREALRFLRPNGADAETFAFPPEAFTPQGLLLGPAWFYGIFQAMD